MIANFGCLMVVARLMAPEEIGVSIVGLAIVTIALSAREFVSTNYLIQAARLSPRKVRSAFTIMAVFTLLVAALLLLSAGTLANIYDDPRLEPYLRIIALSFLVEILSAPTLTLLRREMAFGRIAIINILAVIVSVTTTISLATFGFGYMSFAVGWLAETVVIAGLALSISPRFWIFKPCLSHWKAIVSFGGYNGATMLMQRLYEQLPYLLLGRVLSMHSVAIYSRSLTLCQLPDKIIIGGVASVILPAFAAEYRQGRSLKGPYIRALEIISVIQWPGLCILALLARPAVLLVLGDQWLEAVPLVRIIALAMIFSLGVDLNYPLLVSVGAVRDMFLRTLIIAPVSVLVICAAAFIGLEAVAYSQFIILPFQALVSFLFIRRHIHVRWSDLRYPLFRSLMVTLFSVAAACAVTYARPMADDIAYGTLMLTGAAAFAGWLAGLWLTHHPLADELRHGFNHLDLARRKFARKAGPRSALPPG